MSTEELVNVLVPRRFLSHVYGYIASLESDQARPGGAVAASMAPGTMSNGAGDGGSSSADDWTPSRLRRMVEQSPKAMIDILTALATRPGDWLSTEELAKAIRDKPDANWNTVAGTLGAFGRRVRSRYGLETWPFENRYDYEIRGRVCRMSSDVARQILQFIEERKD